MKPPTDPAGPQQARRPLSDAEKSSLLKTHTLFRIFILTVLGATFIFQLDINYLWLSAILAAASIVIGIIVLIRCVQLKESRLVLFGAISGLVVSAVMVLLILLVSVFFNEARDYQQCARQALTQQAASECQSQLQKSLPAPPP